MSLLDTIVNIQEENSSHRRQISTLRCAKAKQKPVNAELGFQRGKIQDNLIRLDKLVLRKINSIDGKHGTGDFILDYCLKALCTVHGERPYFQLPKMYKFVISLKQLLEERRGEYINVLGYPDHSTPEADYGEWQVGIITKKKQVIYFSETRRQLYINIDKKQLHVTSNRTIENVAEDASPHPKFMLHPGRILIGKEYLPDAVKVYLVKKALDNTAHLPI